MRAFALVVLAALACAPVRPRLGELQVQVERPLFPSGITAAHFVVARGRFTVSGRSAGTRLDLVAMDDACLRGDASGQPVQLCASPPDPSDPPGLLHWHSVGQRVTGYSTRLLNLGDVLRIEAGLITVELRLPGGPAGDEIRQHPEFLGAAFAYGLLPQSKDRELGRYSVEAIR